MRLPDFLRLLFKGPTPKMMAAQLRQPSGMMAKKVGERMNAANRYLYEATWRALQLRDGMSVLEIGFGNGLFFPELAAKAKDLKLTGLDFSLAMMKEAKTRNTELVKHGTLALHFGSSDRMPFADASFDRVYCINVVYFWEDPATHLREVKRVLKPGGQFVAALRTKATMETMAFTRYGFTKYDQAEWEAVLRTNGFNTIHTERLQEPEIEFEGGHYTPESLVVTAG